MQLKFSKKPPGKVFLFLIVLVKLFFFLLIKLRAGLLLILYHLICWKIFNLVNIKVKIKAMVCKVAKCESNFTRGKTK